MWKWSSMGVIRLWTGASYRYWNDGFWLWTHAIFSTYRRTLISPSEIHTHAVMILEGPLTSCEQLPGNGLSPLEWPAKSPRVKIWRPVVTSLCPPVRQSDVLSQQWLTFDVQRDGIFLGQIRKFREPGNCFLQRSNQKHLNTWRLSDLLQDLRDHLEQWKRVQETPPIVPGNRHGIRKLRPGVRIRRCKLDEASVGERRKQVDLWFAPQGKYRSETLHGHRPLCVQCLADSGQRICLDVVDSWQMDWNQCYRLAIAPLQ